MIRQRVRLRFSKQGDLRLIGHRDLLRTLERLFRRAGLPLGMSQGFHPKPRMSFPLALAVGIAGNEEVMELELSEERTAEEVLAVLAPQCPPGLAFLSAEVLPPGSKNAAVVRVHYELPLPSDRIEPLRRRIGEVLAGSECLVRREDRDVTLDIRPLIDRLVVEDQVLHVSLRVFAGQIGARPREVLQALAVDDLEGEGSYLTRTTVELTPCTT